MIFLQTSAVVLYQGKEKRQEAAESLEGFCWFICLDEAVLLKVFSYLRLGELLQVSRVCKQWNRVARDLQLWKTVDLSVMTAYFKGEDRVEAFLKKNPVSRLRELNLSGLRITSNVFKVIAAHCPRLRKLVLKSTELRVSPDSEISPNKLVFPCGLYCLDLRYSNGDQELFLSMASCIRTIRWLGICDAFIYALFKNGKLESTFQRLENLRSLDTSQCLLVKDNFLSIIASCRGLEVLSMRKCISVRGTALEALLSNCQRLKALILDGTSLDDVTMTSISWEISSNLEYLELGWCSLISPKGLRIILPQLARIDALEYLGFQSIGNGKGSGDKIIQEFGALYLDGGFKNVETLNGGSSRRFTKSAICGFAAKCPNIELKLESNCAVVDRHRYSISSSVRDDNNKRGQGLCRQDSIIEDQHYLETPV